MTRTWIDLDDTSGCPVAGACEVCQAETVDLAVATAGTTIGVSCLTLCWSCAKAGDLPAMAVVDAVLRTCAHCDHLGIDLDEMGAALDASPQGAA